MATAALLVTTAAKFVGVEDEQHPWPAFGHFAEVREKRRGEHLQRREHKPRVLVAAQSTAASHC